MEDYIIPPVEQEDKKRAEDNSPSVGSLDGKVKTLQDSVSLLTNLLYAGFFAVFIATLIGVGAILQSYLASKQATYEDLKDKVVEQNSKINEINSKLEKSDSKLDQLVKFNDNTRRVRGY